MNIHLDLDETLIHSLYGSNEHAQNYKEDKFSFTLSNRETYTALLRPIAHDLIMAAVDLVGRERVHITTVATAEYADMIVRGFSFPVMLKNIHARESIHCGVPLVTDSPNILVDNWPWFEHRNSKVPYLNLQRQFTIEINHFYGDADPVEEEEIYNIVVDEMKECCAV